MNREKIARALMRRPAAAEFRAQVFWLVDIIYACKASEDAQLAAQAPVLEQALGDLGRYLETGNDALLLAAQTHLEDFASFVGQPA